MAKVVTNTNTQIKKYPFAEWERTARKLGKDKALRLTRGEDFTCSVKSFKEYFWSYARRNNVQITLLTVDAATVDLIVPKVS